MADDDIGDLTFVDVVEHGSSYLLQPNDIASIESTTASSELGLGHRKRKRSDSDEVQDNLIHSMSTPRDQGASISLAALDDEAASSSMDANSRSNVNAQRDSTYYYEDGSCILLVQDTLFNVHRSILSRDNSSFSTMFTLPQGDHEAEGRSDDNPIVLPGDKASEFRHFLWALYALPPELRIVHSPGADLTQLIDIARIANKYSFKSLETWALDAVQEYVNRKPSPMVNSLSSMSFSGVEGPLATPTQTPLALIENTEQLTRLIQLAQLCNHESLLNTMIALLRQLMSRSLHYAYLAMSLADELGLRALRGAAYLEVMQRGSVVKGARKPAAVSEEGGPEEQEVEITPAQKVRLLSGYWHLTRAWEHLRSTPPPFTHAPSCGATWHQHGCTQSWVEFWKEKTKGDAVLSLGLADVIGRLRQVQKDYDRWGSATYMHHDCRLAARRSIVECIKNVEDRLPDYFSDEGWHEES